MAPALGLAHNLATSIATEQASGLLTGLSRNSTYTGNRLKPNMIPDFRDLSEAFRKGLLSEETYEWMKNANGIGDYNATWNAVIQSKHPMIGIGQLISMYFRHGFSADDLDNGDRFLKWHTRAGWWDSDIVGLAMSLPWPFGPDTIRIMKSMGLLSERQYNAFLASVGMGRLDDIRLFNSIYSVPTPQQTNELYNRDVISDAGRDEWLKLSGFTDDRVRSGIIQLGNKIPSPSELIEFAVKEVWNREVVQSFGYDDEFDQIPEFKEWMRKQGYGGNPSIHGGQVGGPENWAQAFWRAHWKNISPEQAYRMFWRYRPTGGPNNGPRVPEAGVFNIDDVARTLKINDYPPYFRNKLTLLSYNVLRLVDIRRVVFLSLRSSKFKSEVIGDGFTIHQWAKENFLDRGQSPRDADVLASLAVEEGTQAKRRIHERKTAFIRGKQFKVSQEEYSIGIATREQTIMRFGEAGLDNADAVALVNVLDREFAVSCAKANIAVIKKQYFKGFYGINEAVDILIKAGLTDEGARRHVACWQSTMDEEKIKEETQSIRDSLASGMLTYNEAVRRLKILGWVDPETLLENEEIVGMIGE